MSSCHNPAEGATPRGSRSPVPLSNNQSQNPEIPHGQQQPDTATGMQTGATQYTEQPPLVDLQFVETELRRQQGLIEQFLRHWVWFQQMVGIKREIRPISFDPNTQQIVSNNFVEHANRTHVELANAQQALIKKTEECDNIREHWQAVVGELNDLKSSKQIFMVDDAEMTAKWKHLQYCIKNFARTYLRDFSYPEPLTPEQLQLLESVNPLYQEFLTTEGKVHCFFQSFVWLYIAHRILRNQTIVWGKDVSTAVRALSKACCAHRDEDFHVWRAQTGEMLQKERGIDGKTAEILKKKLYQRLVQFIPGDIMHDAKREEMIRRSLEGIIDKAIELATIFNMSRCVYDCEIVEPGMRFDPEAMEHDEEYDAPLVDLMISPALVKYGNSRGQNYDQYLVLAKSHVCSLMQNTQIEERQNADSNEDNKGTEGGNEESLIDV
ncbi:hypothetical protein F5Y10DRAFT_265281 [Nemania abortiva]|nr:hypothetical protein F5Y10DRAFT_265281 [Nemania abortiva]